MGQTSEGEPLGRSLLRDGTAVFYTEAGTAVPALTAERMREVDRIAVEEFGLPILSMMENAGRSLSQHAMEMLDVPGDPQLEEGVVVLAGSGGNGGGGLACARHLRNRGFPVNVVLDRDPDKLGRAAGQQLQILRSAGFDPSPASRAAELISGAGLVVDALIGYGLRGEPRGTTANLIELCDGMASSILSLDVPSGREATTGEEPGAAIHPARTLTLALPKTGLVTAPGELYVADIGIPPELYRRIGLQFQPFFGPGSWVRLVSEPGGPQRQSHRKLAG